MMVGEYISLALLDLIKETAILLLALSAISWPWRKPALGCHWCWRQQRGERQSTCVFEDNIEQLTALHAWNLLCHWTLIMWNNKYPYCLGQVELELVLLETESFLFWYIHVSDFALKLMTFYEYQPGPFPLFQSTHIGQGRAEAGLL